MTRDLMAELEASFGMVACAHCGIVGKHTRNCRHGKLCSVCTRQLDEYSGIGVDVSPLGDKS